MTTGRRDRSVRHKSGFKNLLISVSVFCFICAAAPLFYGVMNTGNYVLAGIGAAFGITGLMWRKISGRKALRRTILALMSAGVLCVASISVLIAWKAWFCPPPETGKQTLIVLGAKVYDYGPSLMLRYRLDKAVGYMDKNPEAVCIVTGGQGSDEPCSEASVMFDYMVSKGIDPARISQEPDSTNTDQNIMYALVHIAADSEGIVIVSNDFHLMRASVYASRHGLDITTLSAFTPPGLLPVYWMREVGGVPFAWLQGLLRRNK